MFNVGISLSQRNLIHTQLSNSFYLHGNPMEVIQSMCSWYLMGDGGQHTWYFPSLNIFTQCDLEPLGHWFQKSQETAKVFGRKWEYLRWGKLGQKVQVSVLSTVASEGEYQARRSKRQPRGCQEKRWSFFIFHLKSPPFMILFLCKVSVKFIIYYVIVYILYKYSYIREGSKVLSVGCV